MNALARTFEAAGLSTVQLNMIAELARQTRAPRTLAVEFPFGHPCGLPGDAALQTRVVRAALGLLHHEGPPPVIVDFEEPWPGDFDHWKKAWHPPEPSPIVRFMREQAQKRAQERRG